MRAVLVKDGKGPVDNLHIGEAPDPVARDNEVIVKIKAFGLNRMDIAQREGKYPPPAGSSEILGVEFSGTIHSLGPKVTEWQIGDEVLGLAGGGAYAEYIAVLKTHIVLKPPSLSWVAAASIMEAFLTAFQAMVLYGEVRSGDNALVHAGASGVGIAAIQLARFRGATNVIASVSTQEKVDWLTGIPSGATHAVNYKTQDFAEETLKITGGRGVDVVIDVVGQTHFEKNLQALAVDGRMTILAFLSGPVISNLNLAPILMKRLKIQGSTLRSRSTEYQSNLIARFKDEILCHITDKAGSGPIKTYIHKVYSWKDIQEATKEMAADKNIGKIVVEID